MSRDEDILEEHSLCKFTVKDLLEAALKGCVIEQVIADWRTQIRLGSSGFWEFREATKKGWGKWRPTTCYPDPKRVVKIHEND